MRNLVSILRGALRYRGMLLGVMMTSLAAAVLWGANLGAIYPIVDVVLKKQSLRQWIDNRCADSEKKCQQLEQRIEAVRMSSLRQPASAGDPRSTELLQRDLEVERRVASVARRMQPWIHRYMPADAFATLRLVVLVLLLGTLVKSLFLVLNFVLVEGLTQRLVFDLRRRLFDHVIGMDLGFFGRERNAHLMSQLTFDVEGVAGGTRLILGRAVLEPLKILACLSVAAWICWRLLFFSLLVTPLALLAINRLARLVKRANHRALDDMAGLFNRLTEALQGIQTVKAFNGERLERRRFRAQGRELLYRTMRIAKFTSLTKPSNELLGMSVIGLALLAGGYLVLNEETHVLGMRMCDRPLDFGLLTTFFAMLAGVSDPFRKLVDVYSQLQQGAAAADRLTTLLEQKPDHVGGGEGKISPSPLVQIEFDNVSFSYSQGSRVLRGIRLKIAAGETIAIVGPNGCGKSTLLALLLRFYEPTLGTLRWNGVDFREIKAHDLRERFGLVAQQGFLFDETVFENIRYGRSTADRNQVLAAARRAHAHEFIENRLPHGYDTRVGSAGKLLSGGQRQRIALARALLRNPEILLLDEATSQIDVDSERLIHASLKDFASGRTTILVTHRPELLALADRIVVMDQGEITDVGTREELLQRCPYYSRLEHRDLRASA